MPKTKSERKSQSINSAIVSFSHFFFLSLERVLLLHRWNREERKNHVWISFALITPALLFYTYSRTRIRHTHTHAQIRRWKMLAIVNPIPVCTARDSIVNVCLRRSGWMCVFAGVCVSASECMCERAWTRMYILVSQTNDDHHKVIVRLYYTKLSARMWIMQRYS